MMIVIFFTHERKTVPNDYAPELLTRIVQSPTKLNEKIWLMKKDFDIKKIIYNKMSGVILCVEITFILYLDLHFSYIFLYSYTLSIPIKYK